MVAFDRIPELIANQTTLQKLIQKLQEAYVVTVYSHYVAPSDIPHPPNHL
jgi:hypothetical protein